MHRWIACAAVLLAFAAPAAAQVREPEMVRIPGGTFVMGTSYDEDAREGVPEQFREWSKPQHKVTIQPFLLAKTAVTRGEYAAFVRATRERPSTGGCYGLKIKEKDGKRDLAWEKDAAWDWQTPGFDQTDDHPAACISHADAMAYIAWLNTQVAGRPYRLPSEAEWEYAARGVANQQAARFWGNGRGQEACLYANVADRTLATALRFAPEGDGFFQCSDGFARTSPVGRFKPNDYGLSDMLGNVWQWTADCWSENYKKSSIDGTANTTGDCGLRVLRGGSWSDDPWSVRSGDRIRLGTETRSSGVGFRLARAL